MQPALNGHISKHALTFDIEEHFQVSAFWTSDRRRQWETLESRVERNTMKIADILASRSTKATFFVLGWVAERHPELVKQLAQCGHEIASHGYGHQMVTNQTPAEFREDIRRSKDILENLIGTRVLGYRAPSFSITSWAIEILVEEGYQYDSSINDRFRSSSTGKAGKPGNYYSIRTPSGILLEISPSTITSLGMQLPVGGGGYFRLLPYSATRMLLKKLERQGSPLVIYLHPWELDPAQPRMKGTFISKARHYLNLDKTEQGLRYLLDDFVFGPIREVAQFCLGESHMKCLRCDSLMLEEKIVLTGEGRSKPQSISVLRCISCGRIEYGTVTDGLNPIEQDHSVILQ